MERDVFSICQAFHCDVKPIASFIDFLIFIVLGIIGDRQRSLEFIGTVKNYIRDKNNEGLVYVLDLREGPEAEFKLLSEESLSILEMEMGNI